MATVSYETACPNCGEMVTAELSVQPEQHGGPETEYLPELWDVDDILNCFCGYVFTGAEEQAVVDAARRELGR
jgi:hypothetical protein